MPGMLGVRPLPPIQPSQRVSNLGDCILSGDLCSSLFFRLVLVSLFSLLRLRQRLRDNSATLCESLAT